MFPFRSCGNFAEQIELIPGIPAAQSRHRRNIKAHNPNKASLSSSQGSERESSAVVSWISAKMSLVGSDRPGGESLFRWCPTPTTTRAFDFLVLAFAAVVCMDGAATTKAKNLVPFFPRTGCTRREGKESLLPRSFFHGLRP